MVVYGFLSVVPIINLLLIKLLNIKFFEKANYYLLFFINILLSIIMLLYVFIFSFIGIKERAIDVALPTLIASFIPAFIIFTYNSIRIYRERKHSNIE